MDILIVEDDDEKYDNVVEIIHSKFDTYSIYLHRADSLSGFVRKVDSQKFDFIIFDILLPRWPKDTEADLSIELVGELTESKNALTPAVALTGMSSVEYDTLLRFNECSIPVLFYGEPPAAWVDQLIRAIEGLSNTSKMDFAICCALPKESNAFSDIGCTLGEWKVEKGAFRWRSITLGDARGALCVFPRMGMTHSALYTSKVIELFDPPLVAMSGICAGLKDECNLLDIIVPESSWDHQVGKATDTGLEQEIHSENMNSDLVAALRHHWETSNVKADLKGIAQTTGDVAYEPSLVVGPVASGSVVVASAAEVSKIEGQQRKVIGLEMEFAAFFAACRFSSSQPLAFGAKAVVDFADADKDDSVQEVAARVSAKYVSAMIPLILSEMNGK